MRIFLGLFLCQTLFVAQGRATEVIHVFVALCDNASQGIVPVPAKIGDGDKPDANLYWGCSDGTRSHFSRSKRWKRQPAVASPRAEILERVIFRHVEKDAWLVADAWRGREIKPCLEGYLKAVTGHGEEEIKTGEHTLKAGGASTLVAFIGHNGLMDFTLEWPQAADARPARQAIVLCCLSQKYFEAPLAARGVEPLLTTRQLMYPGAFILHDAVEVWLAGQKGRIHDSAAAAYAKNQKISVKGARGVFAVGSK